MTELSWTRFPRLHYRDRRRRWRPYPCWAGRRIDYAARLATARWRQLAAAGQLRSVDKTTFKLAVLNKVSEMNLERRATQDRPESYHASCEWVDGAIDTAFELANLSAPAEARPTSAEEREMRTFVSSVVGFDFRSWVDAHGPMPHNVLPTWDTFDFSQLGDLDPGPPKTPLKSSHPDDDEGSRNSFDFWGDLDVAMMPTVHRDIDFLVRLHVGGALLTVACAFTVATAVCPGASINARLVVALLFNLVLFVLWSEEHAEWKPSEALKAYSRRASEWWIGVPPRPDLTPEDYRAPWFDKLESRDVQADIHMPLELRRANDPKILSMALW